MLPTRVASIPSYDVPISDTYDYLAADLLADLVSYADIALHVYAVYRERQRADGGASEAHAAGARARGVWRAIAPSALAMVSLLPLDYALIIARPQSAQRVPLYRLIRLLWSGRMLDILSAVASYFAAHGQSRRLQLFRLAQLVLLQVLCAGLPRDDHAMTT